MMKQMTFQQLLALTRLKIARGKKRFTLFIPPHVIPPQPLKYGKRTVVKDEIAGVELEMFLKLDQNGGWLVSVKVKEEPFNPPIPRDVAEALKGRM
jgi:hypothetical protein